MKADLEETVSAGAAPGSRGHLVFLNESVVDARDYRRFGLAWLADRGYRVSVFDLADLVMPAAGKDRHGYRAFDKAEFRVIRSLEELREALPVLAHAGLIVNNCTFRPQALPVYQMLKRVETPTMFLWDGAVPHETFGSSRREGLASAGAYLLWRIRQGRVLDALCHRA